MVLLLHETQVRHGELVVYSSKSRDDLIKMEMIGLLGLGLVFEDLEDIAIKIESVLEICDFVFEMDVLRTQTLVVNISVMHNFIKTNDCPIACSELFSFFNRLHACWIFSIIVL